MSDPRPPERLQGPPLPARPIRTADSPSHRGRPGLGTRPRRARADSTGVRMVLGLAGLASASALASAMLPSVLPATGVAATGVDTAAADAQQPQPSVIHVTHVVTLAPGETLPPDAGVNLPPAAPVPQATPAPTPRVVIQTITRQSGRP